MESLSASPRNPGAALPTRQPGGDHALLKTTHFDVMRASSFTLAGFLDTGSRATDARNGVIF